MPLALLPDSFRSSAGLKAFVLSLVVICLAVGCFFYKRSFCVAPFWLPLVIFCIIHLIQSGRSLNSDLGHYFLLLQLGCGFVALVVAFIADEQLVKTLFRFMALGGVVVSVIGIFEYWGFSWFVFPSAGRPSSTFGFRNIAGMYLAVGLPLSFALVFEKLPRDRLLGYVAIVTMFVFLVYTRTRGAWVGVFLSLVIGVVLVGWCNKSMLKTMWQTLWAQRKGMGTVMALCGLLMFLSPNFSDQNASRLDEKKQNIQKTIVSMVEPGGDRRRFDIWRHTVEMSVDHLLTGVGLANWAALYPYYDRGDVLGIVVAPKRPHNDFLWIWAELGSIGLIIYFWLLGAVFWQMGHTLKRLGMAGLPALFAGMGALAVLIHGCFSFPREQAVALLPLWIALAIAGQGERKEFSNVWIKPIVIGSGVVIGGLGCLMNFSHMRFDYSFTKSLVAQSSEQVENQIVWATMAQKAGLFDHRVMLIEGEGRRQQEDWVGVVEVYRSYLKYQPFLPAVHNNLGRAYEMEEDFVRAESAYLKGLETFEGDGVNVLQNNLAAVYKKQGRVSDALAVYESMMDKSAEAYHNLGLIYAEQGKFGLAKKAYQDAVATDPDMTIALFSLAGVEMLSNEIENASRHYELFLEQWTGAQDYVRDAQLRLRQIYPVLGDRYIQNREADKAIAVLERLIGLGEASPEAYVNLAFVYAQLGQHQKALAMGTQALVLKPDFGRAHFVVALVFDATGRKAEAIRHYRSTLSSNLKNERLALQAQTRIDQLMNQ